MTIGQIDTVHMEMTRAKQAREMEEDVEILHSVLEVLD